MDTQLIKIKNELKNKKTNINYCVSQIDNIHSNKIKGEAFDLLLEHCDIPTLIGEIANKYNGKFNDIIELIENSKLNAITTQKVKVIGMYYPRLNNGGIERVMEYLTKLYISMGYRVILITDTPSKDDYIAIPKNAKRYDLTRGQSYKQRAETIQKIVKKEKIDTIIYHAWLSNVLPLEMMLYKALGVSFLVHTHGVFSYLVIEPSAYFQYLPKIYSVADAVICLGDVNYAFWSNFNGNVFSVCNPPTFDIKASNVSSLHDNTILWVGRISPEKKPHEALLILAEVCKVVPNTKLKMVGKANSDKDLEQLQILAKKLGVEKNVDFCGFHEDVSSFFLEAAVFVSTSKCEGFPLVLSESKTFGVPIVLYELPYLTISEGNKGMFPVKFGDHKGAANEIIDLFLDREKLNDAGLEARNHALELADYDYSGNWNAIFKSLSNSRKEVELDLPQRLMLQTFIHHYSFDKIEKENSEKYNNIEKITPKQEVITSTTSQLSIVFICDENNIKALAVALVSLLKNAYNPKNIDITILSKTAYSLENTNNITSICDKYDCIINFAVTDNINKDNCEQIALTISNNLTKVDRCIYLDYNVVVQKDLSQLYNDNLGNCTIGGVIDTDSETISPYVLLINCAKIRKSNSFKFKEMDLKYNLSAVYFQNEPSFKFNPKVFVAQELIDKFDKKQLREAFKENVVFSYSDEANPLNNPECSFSYNWWNYFRITPFNKVQRKTCETPKVSVIIPVYNVEKYLRECLDSVINQTLEEIEIICINDSSPDNSLEILREYAELDKRIIILEQENQGAGVARNNGLDVAKGEYLSFLDPDDFFELTMLEQAYNTSLIDESDIVVYNYNLLKNNTETFSILNHNFDNIEKTFNYKNVSNFILGRFSNNAWTKLFKTQFIKDNNIKFQHLFRANDLYFVNVAMVLANKITYLENHILYYRTEIESVSTSNNTKYLLSVFEAHLEFKNKLLELGIYEELEKDFLNALLNCAIWHLNTMKTEETSKIMLSYIRKNLDKDFNITKHPRQYYHTKAYDKFISINENAINN